MGRRLGAQGRGDKGGTHMAGDDDTNLHAPLPAIPGVTFRRLHGTDDYPLLVAVHEGSRDADGIDPRSTLEWIPTAAEFGEEFAPSARFDPSRDVLIVEAYGHVIGYSYVTWWTERDGLRLYLLLAALLHGIDATQQQRPRQALPPPALTDANLGDLAPSARDLGQHLPNDRLTLPGHLPERGIEGGLRQPAAILFLVGHDILRRLRVRGLNGVPDRAIVLWDGGPQREAGRQRQVGGRSSAGVLHLEQLEGGAIAVVQQQTCGIRLGAGGIGAEHGRAGGGALSVALAGTALGPF